MIGRLHIDPDKVIVGSALRRARHLLFDSTIKYQSEIPLALNHIVAGEIIKAPPVSEQDTGLNWIERIYPGSKDRLVCLKNEFLKEGPFIGVLGNRYAPPYLIGGLTHPIDGYPHRLRGEEPISSLFGVNCIGWFDQGPKKEHRTILRILGTLIDEQGPVSLRHFREKVKGREMVSASQTARVSLVLIGGYSTNAGKSTCARALSASLRKRGFRVSIEKKSGTACCRDWISCLGKDQVQNVGSIEPGFEFDPDQSYGRDFVDGLGIASDVSLDSESFTLESTSYTGRLLHNWRPDFHIVELADGLCHQRNWSLLQNPEFKQWISCIIYSPHPSFEAAAQSLSFFRNELKIQQPVLFSGPIANEENYTIAQEEILFRLKTPICPSALFKDQQWVPDGEALADHVCRLHEHNSNKFESVELRN